MSRSRKACRILVAAALAGAVVVAVPPSAGSQIVPLVSVEGSAAVGATLTAVPLPGDPTGGAEYRWQRCPTQRRSSCVPIAEAAGVPSYTVAAADLGSGLAVRVLSSVAGVQFETWSPITDVVTAPPAPTATATPKPQAKRKPPKPPKPPKPHAKGKPDPKGTPHPDAQCDREKGCDEPAPFVESDGPPSPPAAAAPAPSPAALPPPLLRPFPVVRIKGTLLRGGARISLLRVWAPATATVDVRCKGRRCHLRRRSSGSGRIPALERFLRAGTRITIRVSDPHAVGKYVRLVIRDGAAPRRRDACLMPGSGRPVECPRA